MVAFCLCASENPVWSHDDRTVVVTAPADVVVGRVLAVLTPAAAVVLDEKEVEVTVTVGVAVTVA